jgi:hypothetical protein
MSISRIKSARNLKSDQAITERITEKISKNVFLIKEKSTRFEIFSSTGGLQLHAELRPKGRKGISQVAVRNYFTSHLISEGMLKETDMV